MHNNLIKSVNMTALNEAVNQEQAVKYATEHKLETFTASVFLKWGSLVFAALFLIVAIIVEEGLAALPVLVFIVLSIIFHMANKKKRVEYAENILRQKQFAEDNQWSYAAHIEGKQGLKGSEFKPDSHKNHSLTDYFQTNHFSFGRYGYMTNAGGQPGAITETGRVIGVIAIPLSYHLPNTIYITNKKIDARIPLVNKDHAAKFKDETRGVTRRKKVHKLDLSPTLAEFYELFVGNTSSTSFLDNITEAEIQTLTHLKYQYYIEVVNDQIYIYASSSVEREDKLFKTWLEEDVTEILDLIWCMAKIFQIKEILSVSTEMKV